MFTVSAANLVTAMDVLGEFVHEHTRREELDRRLRDLEHAGDQATHAIFRQVNSSFVTPFDREDIYAGGFRIIRTMGRRIIQLTPTGGFAAQTVASGVMVTTATVFAVPVSITHITTTSIMGVGATRRLSAVRWGVAGNIVVAWTVTLPAAAAVAAVAAVAFFITNAVIG